MIKTVLNTSYYIRRAIDSAIRNGSKTVKWETSLVVAEEIAKKLDLLEEVKKIASDCSNTKIAMKVISETVLRKG